MSMKIISKKSTINRANRGWAFAKSFWKSDEHDSEESKGSSSMEGIESTHFPQDLDSSHLGQPINHQHITVTQSGKATSRLFAPIPVEPDQSCDAGCLDSTPSPAILSQDTTLSPNQASSPNPLKGAAPRPSLLPFEFSVNRWDENGELSLLDPDGPENLAPETGAQATRATRPTPAMLQREWVENYREDYLREMIWLEGRGIESGGRVQCRCGQGKEALYRCKTCIGAEAFCSDCIVAGHRQDPFHFIEKWNGGFFEDTTLKSIGLRIQLGHPSHSHCPADEKARRSRNDDFVVLDITGIHEVGLDFCDCETKRPRHIQLLRSQLFPGTGANPRSAVTFRALKFFQILSFESKGSHEEFYNTIVRMTGNVDTKAARDRYHEFLIVVREWRHLKMLKRAGRGHDFGGVDGTGLGDCAIRCPACPRPGVNLPPDWENADPKKKWLYRLFVAIDGNFRLKRRMVSSEERDPDLNMGWAFFVCTLLYRKHLGLHWNSPQDKSTCVAHDAVDKPDREARGLAASGVVAIVCSRHEFRLPNGVGDLQKGERYINIDFVAFSGIRWFKIREIVISYDIACQWHKRLIERMGLLPDSIQPSWLSRIVFVIPKFHLPAHIESCNRNFSFNLTPGVGRTDGEAPERGWSRQNSVAKSTAEMGPGNRRDTIDDHFNDENSEKRKRIGETLLMKMMRALLGREKHMEAYLEYEGSIPPHFLEKWLDEVERWEANPSTEHNPYEQEVQGVSEKQIRLQLAQEAARADKEATNPDTSFSEDEDAGSDPSGHAAEDAKGIHPSLFIAQGLQLEEDQRKLSAAVSALGNHPTAKQLATMAERSNTLRRRIGAWIETQKAFTPAAELERLKHQLADTAIDGSSATEAYAIHLFLPSSLPHLSCPSEVCEYEAKLREGQAYDALDELRRYLRIRAYLYKKKDQYSRGVAQNTRSNTAIARAEGGVRAAESKYNLARKALVYLRGETTAQNSQEEGWRRDLLRLDPKDVRGLTQGLYGESEGSRTISWVWLRTKEHLLSAKDDDIENDVQLQDVLRIEFLRARARAMRWSEEVELLDEEMRRTLESFKWMYQWWMNRTENTIPVPQGPRGVGYGEGFSAYALSQAAVFMELHQVCERTWSKGADKAMKKALADIGNIYDDD